jgi:hypothetical protein
MEIPRELKAYLASSHTSVAEEIWKYLDNNSDCVHEMIEVIAITHKKLAKQLCD